jgi:hypothetical protein
MGVSDISSLVEKYGIKGAIFIILTFLLIATLKSKWFLGVLSKLSDKFVERFMRNKTKDSSKVRNINESDISNHDIFNYIDFWMYSKVPTFQFSTEYRTVVFRRYLTIYLKSYKTNISKFVINKEYEEMDDAKLSTNLMNIINKVVYDYERDMIESGLPSVVIEKMKAKNNDTITLKIDLIQGVCSSHFYSSDKNYLKVYSILNILLSVLENTISNSEVVCNSINGQMKGFEFGGKKEP